MKRRKGIAIYLYAYIALLFSCGIVMPQSLIDQLQTNKIVTILAFAWGVSWFLAALMLKKEINLYFKHEFGHEYNSNTIMTLLFTVIYINYCLSISVERNIDSISGGD
jgi:hypothetical protein